MPPLDPPWIRPWGFGLIITTHINERPIITALNTNIYMEEIFMVGVMKNHLPCI
jgi:hypothetical protein